MAGWLGSLACFATGAAVALAADRFWPRFRSNRMADNLEQALHHDVRPNEFEVYYQPIVELPQRRWRGFEALLRWRSRDGTVSPDRFVPAALEAGLLEKLTVRMIKLVARDMVPVLRQRPDLYVAINTPPELLGRGSLVSAAQSFGLHAITEQVVIEVTETGFVDHITRAEITAARALGARVAIDDFGTGTNGLAQLQDLEIDLIKIDQSFVRKIGSQAPGAKLVDAIVGIAREIDAQTVAEGVETEQQAEYLTALGVEFGQGWLFARPLPLREVRNRLGM